MAERDIQVYLAGFLRTGENIRLANRMISFLLVNLCIYVLLLIALILFDIPLAMFHLLSYISLSLLPLFLLFPPEREAIWRTVRRIDENCQIESYLAASSQEHRSFMESSITGLLAQRAARRVIRFRLLRMNRYLALSLLSLFLVFLVASFFTLSSLTPILSPWLLKSRLAEQKALQEKAEEGAAEQMLGGPAGEQQEPAELAQGQRAGDGLKDRQLAEALEEGTAEKLGRAEARGLRDAALEIQPEPGGEQGQGGVKVRVQAPDSQTGLSSLLEGALERGADVASQAGDTAAGTGDTGRGFRESPLREYGTIQERIAAEGNQELSAVYSLAESQSQRYLSTLFGDFPGQIRVGLDFDPLVDRIKERYLELLRARY